MGVGSELHSSFDRWLLVGWTNLCKNRSDAGHLLVSCESIAPGSNNVTVPPPPGAPCGRVGNDEASPLSCQWMLTKMSANFVYIYRTDGSKVSSAHVSSSSSCDARGEAHDPNLARSIARIQRTNRLLFMTALCTKLTTLQHCNGRRARISSQGAMVFT